LIGERPELVVGDAASGEGARSASNNGADGNGRRANRLRRLPFNPSAKTKLLSADAKLLLEFGQRLERARFGRRRDSGLLANLGEEFGLDRRQRGERDLVSATIAGLDGGSKARAGLLEIEL
jgi:hypothetical protein